MAYERVAKIMAQRGLCSRREAERLIAAGQVLVNGVVVSEQGTKAATDADITIGLAGRSLLTAKLTVLLHKPVGIVSTLPQGDQIPAWKLLRVETVAGPIDAAILERVLAQPSTFSVAGRLDRASRGLLLLTQDGTVAKQLVGGRGISKTYVVATSEPVQLSQVRKLRGPLQLDGRALLPMQVEQLGDRLLRFVLVEGRKHQIRRACAKVGLTVTDLLRSAIGTLTLDGIAEGQWRVVGDEELHALRESGNVHPARRV